MSGSQLHWFDDCSVFVFTNYSFFNRGGGCYNAKSAGVFHTDNTGGGDYDGIGFRVILVDL